MKTGWHSKALGSLCDILDSKRKPITKKDRTVGEYPYYGATGIQDFVGDYLFDEPLILVGEDGAKWGQGENTAFAAQGKFWVNNHAHVLRPNRSILVDNWLIYFLVHSDLWEFVSGLTVPKLNQARLREIPIPLPPLPEQHRIVAILDEAFEGIAIAKANAEKNLKNARAVFESHLNAVFSQRGEGWVEKRLGEIADVQSGGTPLVSNRDFWAGNIAWYSSGELNNVYTTDPGRHITELGLSNSNAKLHPAGSLLIGMYDTAAMKMSILDRDAAFNQAISGVKPNEKVDMLFIFYSINCIKARILAQRRGVRQKNLSLAKIKAIEINVPPLLTQKYLVKVVGDCLKETQRLESLYQKKTAALDQLKQSLLHQAFSGAL